MNVDELLPSFSAWRDPQAKPNDSPPSSPLHSSLQMELDPEEPVSAPSILFRPQATFEDLCREWCLRFQVDPTLAGPLPCLKWFRNLCPPRYHLHHAFTQRLPPRATFTRLANSQALLFTDPVPVLRSLLKLYTSLDARGPARFLIGAWDEERASGSLLDGKWMSISDLSARALCRQGTAGCDGAWCCVHG